jgi:hypothetical protein
MNNIKLLSAIFGITLLVSLSSYGSDDDHVPVYNLTDQPINVSWHNFWGESVKTKDIAPNQSKNAKTRLKINKDTIKAYYAQDKDFKYPFLSSDAKHGTVDSFGVYIYPDKIVSYDPSATVSGIAKQQEIICQPCKADSGALDKVKAHYNIS